MAGTAPEDYCDPVQFGRASVEGRRGSIRERSDLRQALSDLGLSDLMRIE